ncbi:hypothetical protein FF38_08570 [Lucilia cuprina]|uniref:PB1 domain-containing protein n=1 Tax=Lucilia cuprina TaxID=7375 RepID=A0A0L0C2A1_LUCCU|nr:hypothetical protein CVS40_2399 [Lucilia cuprina]KNC26450.1 hypothetical protein FF38_08570 [Lucilia cuprina]
MASKNCVKISYKGLTRQVLCDTKFQYDELLSTVMDKFNINKNHKLAIDFYDEQGHKYNKDTFEYFLLLFPNPQKIFFIRLDSSKIINLTATEVGHSLLDGDDRKPFGKSKLNNKQTDKQEMDSYCEAVPVRRQNCFLGEMPTTTITQQLNSSSHTRNTSSSMTLEIVKRMRLLKQNSPKKKHLNNPTVFKRSMRI